MKKMLLGLAAGVLLAAGLGVRPVTVVVPGTPVPKPPAPWMDVHDGIVVLAPPKEESWDI